MALFTVYLQYSRPPLIYHFCQMFGMRPKPSARLSPLIFRIDHPLARISQSLVLNRVLLSGSFTLVNRSWVRWMFQNLPLTATQEVHDSRMRLLALLWRMMGFCTTKCRRFLMCARRMWCCRSYREGSDTPKRWTYPCFGAVIKELQQRWTRRWCTTPSKHLAKNYK